MSKTFKSSSQANDNRTLSVEKLYGEPRLMISGDVRTGFLLDPSDAPALALAVLEAAGVADRRHWNQDVEDGADVHLEFIAKHLADYIKAQERATAEAREQAELEAEALELINAYRASFLHCAPEDGFEGFDDPEAIKAKWLAVARRAREMRNEKKVTTDD